MASSFAVARLTGEYVLDHHSASQCDPLYDLAGGGWAEDWADAIAPGVPLPRLLWPGEVAGHVTAAGAEATGIPADTPVAAGTVDAWAEALSAGVRAPGDLMLMYGSTMFMVLVADRPRPHPGLWTTAGVEPGTRTLAAGMATSGSLTGWLRDLTGGAPFATLAAEAAAATPGADGLLVLPYFAGERSPLFDPYARGVIAGLTLRHGRPELARAAYEATAFGVRHNLAAFREAAGEPRRVVAVGGGTRAGAWTQIVSDVTGLRQAIPAQGIGAAYGDALLAAVATGLAPAAADWATVADVVEPDPRTQAVYDALFELYLRLQSAAAPISHQLARLQGTG